MGYIMESLDPDQLEKVNEILRVHPGLTPEEALARIGEEPRWIRNEEAVVFDG